MPFSSLSIVIPTFNGRSHLESCLASVRRHAPPATQVIVVDDGSSDGTLDWLKSEHPWVERLRTPSNLGFCGAVNLGLRHATGDVVELLNNDTTVTEGWAEAALVHFADPTVGSVAPLTLRMDEPTVVDSAGQEYHLIGWARNVGYGCRLGPEYLQGREVFGPSGCSGFYRRDALLQLGGLWPEYGAYFEDTDLAFRLRRAGYRCIYEPKSRVFHRGSATYGTMPDRLIRLISRNEELVFWINLPTPWLLAGLIPHLAFQCVRMLRKACTGQLGPYLEGKFDAFRLMGRIAQRRRELAAVRPGHAVSLGVQYGLDVVNRGVTWLRHRRAA